MCLDWYGYCKYFEIKQMNFEQKIVKALNQHESKNVDKFSAFISSIRFLVFFWLFVISFVLYVSPTIGILVLINLIIVFVLHFVVSEAILKSGARFFSLQRMRPYKKFPLEIRGIGRRFSDSSFPSSHMASMVGGFFVLIRFVPSLLPLAIVVTLLLGWSRIRNGMHYPSDIIAGILLGLLYGYLTIHVLNLFVFRLIYGY